MQASSVVRTESGRAREGTGCASVAKLRCRDSNQDRFSKLRISASAAESSYYCRSSRHIFN